MLYNADQSLVERDRQLPGLATLLDDATLLSLLRAAGQDVQTVTSAYLRYKPHTNCLVAYEVWLNQQPHWIYGKVYPPERSDKLTKYRRLDHRSLASDLQPLVVDELGLAIVPFPCDRELRSVVRLLDATTQGKVCRKLLSGDFADVEIDLKTLNYKPERRYVAQASLEVDPTQSWVIKAYTQDDYDIARRNSRDVQPGRVLQAAPRVGRSHRYQMLAFPWVSDPPLSEQMLVVPAIVQNTLKSVGTALAELHSQRLKRLPRVSCVAEALDVMELVSDLCHLHPALTGEIKTLSRTIADGLVNLPQQWRSTHGDFKPDQVLTQGETVTLIDFDRAATAHPARDLGSFIAQLEYQNLCGTLDDYRLPTAVQGLLTGYAAQGEAPPPETLQLYTALHLFKLLPEPFRYRVPDWPTQMENILHRIEETLQPDCQNLGWSA